MAKQKEIAQELGLSISTVSRALSGSSEISPETTEKVLAQAKKCGYRQAPRAKKGKQHSSAETVGIIVPEITSEYYARIVHLAKDAFSAKGYSSIIKMTDFQDSEMVAAISTMNKIRVKCLLIVMDTEEAMSNQIVHALKGVRCAVMLITSKYYPLLEFDCIHLDEYSGIIMGVQHLQQRGYKRIGFLSDKISENRITIFKQAMNLVGMKADPMLICVGSERAESGGYLRMKELLSLHTPPDAVFCSYDQMAVGAIHALRENNYCVPSDMAILGFDNIPVAQYIEGGLTTIANPFEDLISIAVNVLTKRADNMEMAPQQIALKPHLIVRSTT